MKAILSMMMLALLTLTSACGDIDDEGFNDEELALDEQSSAIIDPGEYTLRVRNHSDYRVKVDWVKYQDAGGGGGWEKLSVKNQWIGRDKSYKWKVTNLLVGDTMRTDWWVKYKCADDGISGWTEVKAKYGAQTNVLTIHDCTGEDGSVTGEDFDDGFRFE